MFTLPELPKQFPWQAGKNSLITQGGQTMIITVSAKGDSLDSDVDPRFGRSTGFVLFDTDTGNSSYLDNSVQRDLSQGTGIQAARMIAEAGTEALITGQLGPKAAKVLNKTGIKIYACTAGTVQEAIQSLKENKLKELSDEAVRPGTGKMGGRGKGGGRRGTSKGEGCQGTGAPGRGQGKRGKS
jgi:predicted Fe-Mo cluster-binding NifX family protein